MAKLASELMRKYPKFPHIARHLLDVFPNDIEISEFTPVLANQLRVALTHKVSKNTAFCYLKLVKAVLNMYDVDNKVKRQFRIKTEDTQSIYLDEDEINTMIRYAECPVVQKTEKSQNIADKKRMYTYAFIISASCGMRMSDTLHIRKDNIQKGILTYTSQKTGVMAQVPAKPNLILWIKTLQNLMKKFTFTEDCYKHTIKTICKECGFNDMVLVHRAGKDLRGPKWKFVGTHTARRSFATNLYIRGCDIYTIGRFLGHRPGDMQMTAKYICCQFRPLDENIQKFFN